MRVALIAGLAMCFATVAMASLHHPGLEVPTTALEAVIAAAHGDPSLHFTPTCVDPSDCTVQLQAALDNTTAPVVRLTAAGSPWITLELYLRRSNVAVVVEEGAVLLAKRWAFNSTGASLFTVTGTENVYITGGGSFRMWRSDYANPKWYKHAEWRMALRLEGVANMHVENVALEYSGGDGIYVTGDGSRNATVNLTLVDVRSRFNYRQGMSVIAAQGLTAVNTVFEGTKGTPPMAGVDLEPDEWWQPITGLRFTNCTFNNNSGAGFVVAPHAHDERSLPYDVTIDDSTFNGNRWGIYLAAPVNPPAGTHLSFSNIAINGSKHEGITCMRHPSAMQRAALFTNVSITGAAVDGGSKFSTYPIYVSATCNMTVFDGVSVDATARPTDRHFAVFQGLGPGLPTLAQRGVYGRFVVRGPNRDACIMYPANPGPTIDVTCDA